MTNVCVAEGASMVAERDPERRRNPGNAMSSASHAACRERSPTSSRYDSRRKRIIGLFIPTLIWGCAADDPSPTNKRHVVQTEVGPVAMEVTGFAGGLTNVGVTRLIAAGVEQGCTTPLRDGIRREETQTMTILWNVTSGATPHASTLITARLMRDGKQLSFAYDRTTSISSNPYAVFERIVSQIACSLFRKAAGRPLDGDAASSAAESPIDLCDEVIASAEK